MNIRERLHVSLLFCTWLSFISLTKNASPFSPNFMCKFTGSPLISMSTWLTEREKISHNGPTRYHREVRQHILVISNVSCYHSPLSLVISGHPSFRSAREMESRSEPHPAVGQRWHRCSRTVWRDSDPCRVPSPARTPGLPTDPRNSWSESTWRKEEKCH